jgi:hypothetical protein
LIQYGPDIPAELYMIWGSLMKERAGKWPQ